MRSRNFLGPLQIKRIIAEAAGLPVSRIPFDGYRVKDRKDGGRTVLGVIPGGKG
jgi:hypothetical protein